MELPSEMPYFIVPDATLQQLKCTLRCPKPMAFRTMKCGISENKVWHWRQPSVAFGKVIFSSSPRTNRLSGLSGCVHCRRMQFIQQVQIHIRHKNHFGIRSGFRTLAVCGESEVAGMNTPDWAYWMSMLCTRGRLPTLPAITTKHSFSMARAWAHTFTRL